MRRPVAATTGSSNQRRGGQWMWWLPLLWFFTTPYWIVGYTIANSPPIDPDCPLSAECTVKYESVSGQVATFFTVGAVFIGLTCLFALVVGFHQGRRATGIMYARTGLVIVTLLIALPHLISYLAGYGLGRLRPKLSPADPGLSGSPASHGHA